MISIALALAALATPSAPTNLLELGAGPGAWSYPYGGTTKGEITGSKDSRILNYDGDDREWSGWTIHLPQLLDLSSIRSQGSLKLKIKGNVGGEEVVVGLLDDESDGPDKKVQIRLPIKSYGSLEKGWKTVTIPLSDFDDRGAWWDPKNKQEVSAKFDWSKVCEVRISSNLGANSSRADSTGLFHVQIGEWMVLDSSNGWNAAGYWKAFKSDAADDTLEGFGGENPQSHWFLVSDEASKRAMKLADPKEGRALELSYTMSSWVTMGASLNNLPGKTHGNWTRHAGMAAEIWSPRADVGLQLQVTDSGKEQWVKNVTLASGWNSVIASFKDFRPNKNWQPDGAIQNGKIDLNGVQTLGFQPLQQGVSTVLRFGSIRLTNQSSDPKIIKVSNEIRWNHLGYAPKGTKRIVVANPTDSVIELLNASGKSVWKGTLKRVGKWDPSEEEVAQADFTGFQTPGVYSLVVGKTKTSPFPIENNTYAATFRDGLRAYYYWRASTDLAETHAGIWQRTSGHPDTNLVLVEAGREGRWSAPGGWYDAGDYGKYTLNGAVSVAILLGAYDLYPELFLDKALNIPESGNGIPDLVDECIWELDWLTRMQDDDGGVFFKVASKSWDGMVVPAKARNPRFVIGKSTTSTLTFAAVAAQASRLLTKIDATRSKDLATRAEKAWAWAKQNPSVRHPHETGGSGAYEDSNFSDEFLWAATELWLSTGKADYRLAAKSGFASVAIGQTTNWQNVQNFAYYDMALHGEKDSLASFAKSKIDSMANEIKKQIEASAYRMPMQGFPWGSNDGAMGKAGLLAWAEHFKPGVGATGVQETVDYILGKNATGYSFVTGTGEQSARHPHHRTMSGDGIDDPIPGFMVGGPNSQREDDIKKASWGVEYAHTEPAKCWMDTDKSYASNEVAVNWNAAYIFGLAALQHQLGSK